MSEIAWCIERESSGGPAYATTKNGLLIWDQDINKAIRFSRREDAEKIASVMGDEVDRIAEHMWADDATISEEDK